MGTSQRVAHRETASPLRENCFYPKEKPFHRGFSRLIYRLVYRPVAHMVLRWRYGWRLQNLRVLRGFRKKGLFLYGNRTGTPLDAYIPACLSRKAILLPATKEAVEENGTPLRTLCGILPVPETPPAYRPFLERLEKHTVKRGAVVIYPADAEDTAPFLYPVRFDEASFVFTTRRETNQKGKTAAVTYLDGPFYPNATLPLRERVKELKNRLRAVMAHRLKQGEKTGGDIP